MSDTDDSPARVTIATDTADQPGRLRRVWDTLQDTVRQPVETVTRRATLQTTGGDVEDIDPPADIDQLYALYEELGIIRASLNQFVSDVVEPGVRVTADDDATAAYFMGGDDAPEAAPEGGFLSECAVTDETRQPFEPFLKTTILNRWVRGTILIEQLKDDPDDPESIITGYTHIRPETVSARTYENTTRLIAPDDVEEAAETTRRDEAAAYVQFDENAILGRREGIFGDRVSVPLSQRDVIKQTLDRNIGGEDPEDGVFGTSILRAVKDDATEYRSIKRDQATAVKGKAWGLWTAQFTPEVIDTDTRTEIIRWSDDDIGDAEGELENIGPGSTLTTDANIDLERHDSDVPDLDAVLDHYIDAILAPLPAPKYAVGFEENINQFVTTQQEARYEQVIREERDYQERQWEAAFREVAARHDALDPAGLTVHIEPEEDESPVMALDMETIEKIQALSSALKDLAGASDPVAVFGADVVRELVAQLPEDVAVQDALAGPDDASDALDEGDAEVQAQFERLLRSDD
jgi:hypothetical protein